MHAWSGAALPPAGRAVREGCVVFIVVCFPLHLAQWALQAVGPAQPVVWAQLLVGLLCQHGLSPSWETAALVRVSVPEAH